MTYVIRNINDPTLFWSNDYGWVDWPTCDEFSEEDTVLMSLPIEGKWEEA